MSGASTPTVCAFLAVGSNIDPEKSITTALEALQAVMPVEATSTFFRTRPLQRPEQADFFNGVWRITTHRPALEVKHQILRPIENELGRARSADPHEARTLDLDLILYGDVVISEVDLVLPDPDIRRRPFVAVPLLELAPELVLPDDGRKLSSLPVARDTSDLEALDGFTDRLKRIIAKKRTTKR